MKKNKHIFCFGFGYTASHLLDKLNGWRISGTCRDEEKRIQLEEDVCGAYLFDKETSLASKVFCDDITHILISIPPDAEYGDIVLKHHMEDLRKLKNLKWVGYLSTTGVYGDYGGAWVDENTEAKPFNARTERRLAAEKLWLKSGLPVNIFRLSGIYGVERSVIDALRDGTAKRIDKKGQVFSRIHVEDIANILKASMDSGIAGQIYNCADDMPCSQSEVVEYAAQLLNVEFPELVKFEDADLSDMAKSFYACNRRVSNKKIKQDLGIKFLYPTYKEGLNSILKLPTY